MHVKQNDTNAFLVIYFFILKNSLFWLFYCMVWLWVSVFFCSQRLTPSWLSSEFSGRLEAAGTERASFVHALAV